MEKENENILSIIWTQGNVIEIIYIGFSTGRLTIAQSWVLTKCQMCLTGKKSIPIQRIKKIVSLKIDRYSNRQIYLKITSSKT